MRLLIFTIAFLAGVGCVHRKKIPEDILSQDTMRRIMWDLIRTDVYVSDFLSKDSTINKDEERLKLYEQVYRLHSTDREIFKKSLVFYQSRPDLLKVITDSLRIDEKKAIEQQYDNYKPKAADTIQLKAKSMILKKGLPNSDSLKRKIP